MRPRQAENGVGGRSGDFNESKPRAASENNSVKDQKLLSGLIFSFGVLLFLALVSYKSEDALYLNLSLAETFGLLTGDAAALAKTSEIGNWLGVFGAFVSDFLYNRAFGYAVFFSCVFIILIAVDLFNKGVVSKKLRKGALLYSIFTILISSAFGAFGRMTWTPELASELSGDAGRAIAAAFSAIFGSFGAMFIFILGMSVAFVAGFKIDLKSYFSKLDGFGRKRIPLEGLWTITKRFGAGLYDKVERAVTQEPSEKNGDKKKSEKQTAKDGETKKPEFSTKPVKPAFVYGKRPDEPARLIKKSLRGKTPANGETDLSSKPQAKTEDPVEAPSIDAPPQDEAIIEDALIVEESVEANDNIEKDIPENINTEDIAEAPVEEDIEEDDKADAQNFDDSEEDEDETISDIEKDAPEDESPAEDASIEEDVADEEESEDIDDESEEADDIIDEEDQEEIIEEKPAAAPIATPAPKPAKTVEIDEKLMPEALYDEEIGYVKPTLDLLEFEESEEEIDEAELEMNARILTEKLESFKITIENMRVTPGPVVTQYEFVPGAGIKISKIESLADDLAMALKARGIRIIAPIPGKGTVGVEIPNQNPSMVRFGDVAASEEFSSSKMKLPLALGKTISGEVYLTDLSKTPHLLIAGATGSGKSVGINTLIASLLYRMHPRDLKFVIIDPKKVELQQYSRLIDHFIAKCPDLNDTIITNPVDAVHALKSTVVEMERRYDTLASVGQRNIKDYNKKAVAGAFKDSDEKLHRPMPYIVVIIDELADLMLTAGKEIEEPIARLAQMARAVGIHLVIATQRPSVDVITGVIKANFPARMAYLVAQKVDSRTILDMSGAEQLLGNGDMLYLANGSPKPIRIQNSFISTDEVEEICDFISEQAGFSEPYALPSLTEKKSGAGSYAADDRDVLFEEAARLIVRQQQGSVSLIQRRLKVGYARAGRIVDELEDAGVVGPFDGSKARQVLVESEADLEAII